MADAGMAGFGEVHHHAAGVVVGDPLQRVAQCLARRVRPGAAQPFDEDFGAKIA